MEVGAVLEVQSIPHPVVRPPVAIAPRMITLARPGQGVLLVPDPHGPGDAARDFVAGRHPPLVRGPGGFPGEVERHLDRCSGFAPQRRRVILERLPGPVQCHPKAPQRLPTLLRRVERVALDRLRRIVGVGERRCGVEHDDRRLARRNNRRAVQREILIGNPADACVDAEAGVVRDGVEVPALVPRQLRPRGVAALVGRRRNERGRFGARRGRAAPESRGRSPAGRCGAVGS